jgi:hypothetical protein
MVLYSCVLIVFLLCRESLKFILVDEPPPWGGSVTPTIWYNVDEDALASDLSIFAMNGETVGSSTSYYSTIEERKAVLLYMYTNIDGMDKYFE